MNSSRQGGGILPPRKTTEADHSTEVTCGDSWKTDSGSVAAKVTVTAV